MMSHSNSSSSQTEIPSLFVLLGIQSLLTIHCHFLSLLRSEQLLRQDGARLYQHKSGERVCTCDCDRRRFPEGNNSAYSFRLSPRGDGCSNLTGFYHRCKLIVARWLFLSALNLSCFLSPKPTSSTSKAPTNISMNDQDVKFKRRLM